MSEPENYKCPICSTATNAKRGGKKWQQIKEALEAKGVVVDDLYWEPIGMSIEMQGREGGWMFCSDEHGHTPIGLNAKQALEYIEEFIDVEEPEHA